MLPSRQVHTPFPLKNIKKEDEKRCLKDLSRQVWSLFVLVLFFPGCTITHWRGEWLPVCLPPLICTDLGSTTHTHLRGCKILQKTFKRGFLQYSWAFTSEPNQDTGTIVQSAMSANFLNVTDSRGNNFAFIWCYQRTSLSKPKCQLGMSAVKSMTFACSLAIQRAKLREWLKLFREAAKTLLTIFEYYYSKSKFTSEFNFKIDEISSISTYLSI